MTLSALEQFLFASHDDEDASSYSGRRRWSRTSDSNKREGQTSDDDLATVVRLRGGDIAAFELVFRRYYSPLSGFLRTIVRSEADSADIVDDLFATLWLNREQLEVRTSLASYLYRSARNRALNLLRSRRTRDQFQLQWRPDDDTAQVPTPGEALDREELSRVIERLLATLPERRRVAVTLRWKAGLSHAEIGEILGITVQSVANLINRALHDLRKLLPDDFA